VARAELLDDEQVKMCMGAARIVKGKASSTQLLQRPSEWVCGAISSYVGIAMVLNG
jgi:hypothetical protein